MEVRVQHHATGAMHALGRVAGGDGLRCRALRATDEVLHLFALDPESRRTIREIGQQRDERHPRVDQPQRLEHHPIEVRHQRDHQVRLTAAPVIRKQRTEALVHQPDGELQQLQFLGHAERPAASQPGVVEIGRRGAGDPPELVVRVEDLEQIVGAHRPVRASELDASRQGACRRKMTTARGDVDELDAHADSYRARETARSARGARLNCGNALNNV